MTTVKLLVASSLAVFAAAAGASATVNVGGTEGVGNVPGRADMNVVPRAEAVGVRPPDEVSSGGAVDPGPRTLAIQAHPSDVNAVAGRA